MPDEVREHLTRDQRPFLHPESLQILQIHSSMTVLLLFGSPHSFSIGCRSGNWNGHSRSLVLCPVTHFCVVFKVCFWIIVRLEDTNMAHYKISNRVKSLFDFFIGIMVSCQINALLIRGPIKEVSYHLYYSHCILMILWFTTLILNFLSMQMIWL